jgi:hypothetical protein
MLPRGVFEGIFRGIAEEASGAKDDRDIVLDWGRRIEEKDLGFFFIEVQS